MAIFHDGISDNLQSSMLASIQWQIRYGVMSGSATNSPAWEQLLGKGEHGTYKWSAAEICGGMTYTVQWNRDEGIIRFYLTDAVQPF